MKRAWIPTFAVLMLCASFVGCRSCGPPVYNPPPQRCGQVPATTRGASTPRSFTAKTPLEAAPAISTPQQKREVYRETRWRPVQ